MNDYSHLGIHIMVAVIQKGAKKLNSQRSSMRGSVSRRRVRLRGVCHLPGGNRVDVVVVV